MIVVVTAKRCGREVTFRPLRLGWVLEQVLYVGSVPDSPFPAGASVATRDYKILIFVQLPVTFFDLS